MANHAVLLRAERFDRTLRSEIEIIRAQPNHLAAELVERVREQQQLAAGIDVRAPDALAVPRPADLDSIDNCDDVVIARRADDLTAREISDDPRQHVARALPLERILDV